MERKKSASKGKSASEVVAWPTPISHEEDDPQKIREHVQACLGLELNCGEAMKAAFPSIQWLNMKDCLFMCERHPQTFEGYKQYKGLLNLRWFMELKLTYSPSHLEEEAENNERECFLKKKQPIVGAEDKTSATQDASTTQCSGNESILLHVGNLFQIVEHNLTSAHLTTEALRSPEDSNLLPEVIRDQIKRLVNSSRHFEIGLLAQDLPTNAVLTPVEPCSNKALNNLKDFPDESAAPSRLSERISKDSVAKVSSDATENFTEVCVYTDLNSGAVNAPDCSEELAEDFSASEVNLRAEIAPDCSEKTIEVPLDADLKLRAETAPECSDQFVEVLTHADLDLGAEKAPECLRKFIEVCVDAKLKLRAANATEFSGKFAEVSTDSDVILGEPNPPKFVEQFAGADKMQYTKEMTVSTCDKLDHHEAQAQTLVLSG